MNKKSKTLINQYFGLLRLDFRVFPTKKLLATNFETYNSQQPKILYIFITSNTYIFIIFIQYIQKYEYNF